MTRAHQSITAVLVVIGALAFTSTPAWAGNGYENVTRKFGGPGSGPGLFNKPTAIAVNDETEDVYVLDSGNDRVEYFTSAGGYLGEFDGSGTHSNEGKAAGSGPGETLTGKFLKPGGIAIDQATGDIYVADTGPGHEVIDKFSATGKYEGQLTGTCKEEGEVPPACSEEAKRVPFVGLLNVTVDASGDVWVYESNGPVEVYGTGEEYTLKQVDEISSTGTAIRSFPIKVGQESEFPGFAVDSSDDIFVAADGELYEWPMGTGERATIKAPSGELAALAMISANNDLLVDQGSTIELFKSPIGGGAQPILTFPTTGLAESEGIAVNGAKGDGTIYATQRGSDDVDVFDSEPAKAPEVVSESASSVELQAVKFAAVVDPENRETTYSFEYSYSKKTVEEGKGEPAAGGSIPAGFGDEQVSSPVVEELEGKSLKTDYTIYYRVVAENEESKGTPTYGEVEAYTKVPLIAEGEEKFSELTSTSATLEATINPVFESTKYFFEYSESKGELESGNGIVIHGTTGKHQEQKLAELKKLEEQRQKEEQEGRIPPGTATICPGIAEEGGTGELPEVNKPCPVSAEISSLVPGHTYYYRVVAENEVTHTTTNANEGKPVAGKIKEFTPYAAPEVITGGAQNITGTAATLSGEVDPEGTEARYYFAYISEAGFRKALENGAADPEEGEAAYQAELAKGDPSPYAEGETTATNALPVGDQPVTVGPIPANDLLPGTTYHYALVSVNKYAIQTIGGDHTFTTGSALPPVVSTGGASNVSQNAATLSGTVTTNGLQTNYGFEIGTAPGVYGPATGLGSVGGATTGEVHVTLGELQPGTTYYYRVTATNADGTVQGQPVSFTTPGFPTLISPPASPPLIAYVAPAFPKEEKTSGTTVKTLTNKEKLAKALKACKQDKSKTKKAKCEKAAKKKFPVAKAKKKAKKK